MSEFQYSGFVSYRNGIKDEDDILNSFAKQFYTALRSELKSQLDIDDVFLDIYHLEGGGILNAKISKGICTSVCHIVVFTRNYLSKKKMYCAAELMGILECEKKRFEILGWDNPTKGFIFPVILRNPDKLPDILRQNRIFYDFSKYTLADIELKRNPIYVEKFKELAALIADLYEDMENEKNKIIDTCNNFEIRDINNPKQITEIQAFIEKHSIKITKNTLEQS
jgi:hypothetical protein